jgi:uncharacterized protein YqgV (UPF0045/DUF77 family)
MQIVAELSMYPLSEAFEPAIIAFIHDLKGHEGLEVVSNQMSTQVHGAYDTVTSAINESMRRVMEGPGKVVIVVKYLNADLDIHSEPELD